MKEETEKHERRFRQVGTPVELFRLVDDGTISPKEAWLILNVDSFVQNTGDDCFASNTFLGRCIKVNETEASRYVSRLLDLGLLIQSKFDGRKRYMHSFFSRPSIRELRKNATLPCANPQGSIDENRKHKEEKKYKEENTLSQAKSLATDSEGGHPLIGEKERIRQLKQHPRWAKMEEELVTALRLRRAVNMDTSKWRHDFAALHIIDKVPVADIWVALRWICSRLPNRPDMDPVIESGKSFREKYLVGKIQSGMDRAAPKPKLANKWREDDGNDNDNPLHHMSLEERHKTGNLVGGALKAYEEQLRAEARKARMDAIERESTGEAIPGGGQDVEVPDDW